jgi:hypothetical protein
MPPSEPLKDAADETVMRGSVLQSVWRSAVDAQYGLLKRIADEAIEATRQRDRIINLLQRTEGGIEDCPADEIDDLNDEAKDVSDRAAVGEMPEPLMPGIDPELLARANKRWPLLTWSRHQDGEYSLGAWDGCRATQIVYRETWPAVISFLEAECPEPSEPEAEIKRPIQAWRVRCDLCQHDSVIGNEEPCVSCTVPEPGSKYEPKP